MLPGLYQSQCEAQSCGSYTPRSEQCDESNDLPTIVLSKTHSANEVQGSFCRAGEKPSVGNKNQANMGKPGWKMAAKRHGYKQFLTFLIKFLLLGKVFPSPVGLLIRKKFRFAHHCFLNHVLKNK